MMKRALPLLLLAIACGKQTFLAAAFVNVPSFPNPEDQAHPFAGYALMTAYFGTIDTTDPTSIDASKVAAITDGAPNVSWYHANDPTQPRYLYPPSTAAAQNKWAQSTNGTYTLNSNDEPLLTFEPGVPYTLVLQSSGGDAYGASFVPGPADDMQEFAATTATCNIIFTVQRCIQSTAVVTAGLTVTRVDQSGSVPAFILVGQVDPNNPTAQPKITYQSIPTDAASLLKYELSSVPYQFKQMQIPSSAFPGAGIYVVVLVTAKAGTVSGNAFLGSTALVGTGNPGIVIVE
jgi:hypothetical protein